jgi:hypothetical protein
MEPAVRGFRYTTDGGVFQMGRRRSAVLVCGPGDAPLRAANESVTVQEYLDSTAIYTHAVAAICRRD